MSFHVGGLFGARQLRCVPRLVLREGWDADYESLFPFVYMKSTNASELMFVDSTCTRHRRSLPVIRQSLGDTAICCPLTSSSPKGELASIHLLISIKFWRLLAMKAYTNNVVVAIC